MAYLGLGKTLFNSSACLMRPTPGNPDGRPEIELVLSERILRKKATGAWPEKAIRALGLPEGQPLRIAENRDVHAPAHQEAALNTGFPFFDYLKASGLARFSRQFNPDVEFVPHHRCHAMAAVALSPFEKCLIVVMDGAGSLRKDFPDGLGEVDAEPDSRDSHEECSVYLHDRGKLQGVFKRWRVFQPSVRHPEHTFSDGVGILYEKAAEYVFNSGRAAGKVMGLASFGQSVPIGDRRAYLEALDWSTAFRGKSKQEWEDSGRFAVFANLAASVQAEFEDGLFTLIARLRQQFPEVENLILTGGCALNCTANGKLLTSSGFRELFVPPFPGDECIGLGAASFLYYTRDQRPWEPLRHADQHGYFGPSRSTPTDSEVDQVFAGFEIVRPDSIETHTARLLAQGEIVAWFQGRSESGPRALGNRSILANPAIPGIKNRLNHDIKFRENFRPYGSSCPRERVEEYFDVSTGFNSPYMSFAVRPRASHAAALREVCHVDGTSRIQTVRRGQNPRFHELLWIFGAESGLACLLNTSLNIMGEPIVETLADARRFLESAPVHGLAIGDHYVRRRP